MPHSGDTAVGSPFIASRVAKNNSVLVSIANRIFAWARTTQPLPAPGTGDVKLRVVCVSDTHNTRPSLPDGDILVHAGDLSQYGTFDEVQAQLDWLNAQSHPHKVAVAGNHDLILDQAFVKAHPDRELNKHGKSLADLKWGDVVYLQDAQVVLECKARHIKIYGSPWTPRCGNFAFQYSPDDDIWTETIPEDIDVLVTHGPPATHLDEGKGCPALLKEVWRARPSLIVFGHIHGGHGEETVLFDRAQGYHERVLLGKTVGLNLFKLIMAAVLQRLWRKPGAGNAHGPTRLVNAAVLSGQGESLRQAIVTRI